MRLTEPVTRILELINNILSQNLKRRAHLEDVNIGTKRGLNSSAIIHFLKMTLSYKVEAPA
jgi:hypothetical protein